MGRACCPLNLWLLYKKCDYLRIGSGRVAQECCISMCFPFSDLHSSEASPNGTLMHQSLTADAEEAVPNTGKPQISLPKSRRGANRVLTAIRSVGPSCSR